MKPGQEKPRKSSHPPIRQSQQSQGAKEKGEEGGGTNAKAYLVLAPASGQRSTAKKKRSSAPAFRFYISNVACKMGQSQSTPGGAAAGAVAAGAGAVEEWSDDDVEGINARQELVDLDFVLPYTQPRLFTVNLNVASPLVDPDPVVYLTETRAYQQALWNIDNDFFTRVWHVPGYEKFLLWAMYIEDLPEGYSGTSEAGGCAMLHALFDSLKNRAELDMSQAAFVHTKFYMIQRSQRREAAIKAVENLYITRQVLSAFDRVVNVPKVEALKKDVDDALQKADLFVRRGLSEGELMHDESLKIGDDETLLEYNSRLLRAKESTEEVAARGKAGNDKETFTEYVKRLRRTAAA